MKRSMCCLLILSCLVMSCAEPEDQIPIIPTFENSPTCAYQRMDQTASGWRHRIYFFDLNHEETKDKKFFAAEFASSTADTMIVVVEPQSIDNLGKDFPAEIMEYPGYGTIGFWSNADFMVRHTPDRTTFYKDFAPQNPLETRYFMNTESIVGSMKGKWPNVYLFGMRIPDGGQGDHRKVEVFFYFEHGMCVASQYFYPGGDESGLGIPVINDGRLTLHTIDDVFPHIAGAYDWETVASVIVEGVQFPSYVFMDFKKWRFFKWDEGLTPVIGDRTYRTITYGAETDLDKMMKWPEGWGKP